MSVKPILLCLLLTGCAQYDKQFPEVETMARKACANNGGLLNLHVWRDNGLKYSLHAECWDGTKIEQAFEPQEYQR